MSAPPDWFVRALAAPCDSRFVEVEGARIHYLRWGDPAAPGLLLVPGGGGHAHWFSHVAPLFADQFNVVAIDLAGSGDSDRRPAYSMAAIAAEIMAVARDAGMADAPVPPILVGHSIGGQFAVRTAMAHGADLLGVIAVDSLRYARLASDSAVAALDSGRIGSAPAAPPRPAKLYPDRDSAVARFRLLPEPLAPIGHPYIVDHIARHSVRPVAGGWERKADPAQMSVMTLGLELKDALAGLPCHAAALYGEHTHLADENLLPAMAAATGGTVPVFRIPGASHYPMIDNPAAFVAAIKGVALGWVAAARRAGSGRAAADDTVRREP